MKKGASPKSSCYLLFAVIFISALLSARNASSLEAPKGKYIDKGACPFECCRYGPWKGRKTTTAYASPDASSDLVGEYQSGTKVTALTGEVHTVPGRFIVKKAHARYKPGDVILVLTYLGEAHFKIWFNLVVRALSFWTAAKASATAALGRFCLFVSSAVASGREFHCF